MMVSAIQPRAAVLMTMGLTAMGRTPASNETRRADDAMDAPGAIGIDSDLAIL
jgi:hypothetical protein